MKLLLALIVLPLAQLAASDGKDPGDLPLPVDNSSLVRVNSTNQAYDLFRPWMKKAPTMRRGLGVVLADGQVLVTAELVANRTYVELEKADSAEKSPAEVVVVDYECNLALLKPVNPEFLAKARPLKLDTGARVGDTAMVLQLESNGLIAQTPATITTITVTGYPLDALPLLTFRVSAPLQNREGSFTIPAVRGSKLLGLLMRYDVRTQTADLIPAPVIKHFLADTAKSPFPRFPRVGVEVSTTRDPQFRRYIGLKEPGGVYVTEVKPGSPGDKAGLRRGDVIVAVAGKQVDQDGNYENPDFGKISFSYLTNTAAHTGDIVEFEIFRAGKKEKIPVSLAPIDPALVVSEPYSFDAQPHYFILGGLVFQELSRAYLQEWGGSWGKEAPQRLVYLDAYQDEREKTGGKVVFLSQVLPSPQNLGYQDLEHLVLRSLNGVEVKNLDDLKRAAAAPVNGFHKIEFEDDPGFIYLDANEVEKGKSQLMKDYNIPSLER